MKQCDWTLPGNDLVHIWDIDRVFLRVQESLKIGYEFMLVPHFSTEGALTQMYPEQNTNYGVYGYVSFGVIKHATIFPDLCPKEPAYWDEPIFINWRENLIEIPLPVSRNCIRAWIMPEVHAVFEVQQRSRLAQLQSDVTPKIPLP